jgi:murein DD-endopeptidase MepM/ murein hydrolase activator NlpD
MALVLVAGSIVAPAPQALGAGTGSSPPTDVRALDQQRKQLQQRYAEVDVQMAALLTSYDEARAAQSSLDAQVADLDSRIITSTSDLQAAESQSIEADARVGVGEQRVRASERRLGVATANLRAQALASYMGDGPLAMVSGVVSRADVDLLIAIQYARLVADVQQRHIDEYASEKDALAREQDRLTAARAVAASRRSQIAAAKADLERQRAEQQALREQAAQKVAEQQQLVQQLQARKASYQSQIDELQRESAQIAALLRARAASTTTTTKPKTTTTKPKPTTTAVKKTTPTVKPGTPTTKPVTTAKPATTTTRPANTIAPPAGAPAFRWPIPGAPVVSGFGMRVQPVTGIYQLHAGVDLWAAEGTPIHAAAGGTVVSVGVHHGYGNAVIIDHGGGWATVYAHQSQTAASVGQRVNAGDVIGYVGHTGLAAGPHLHFEIRVNGDPVDPLRYVRP